MFLSQRSIFFISPHQIFISSLESFVVSPAENVFLGLTMQNVWKFDIFPGESSSFHRGTETGSINIIEIKFMDQILSIVLLAYKSNIDPSLINRGNNKFSMKHF